MLSEEVRKKSLLRLLGEVGLIAEKINYFFFASFFAVAPIRTIRKLFVLRRRPHSDTTTLPPKLLNEFLKFLFRIEIKISDIFRLPFGPRFMLLSISKNIRFAVQEFM